MIVSIFAASGSIMPINEISDSFLTQYSIPIDKNFAASGTLARQIADGAKADIFISANIEWINYLKTKNLLIDSSIYKLAGNRLVVICHKSKNVDIKFTNDFNIKSIVPDKIAIGDPLYVPAGKYAKQTMSMLGWYNQIQDRIILTKDVSSALHIVELNECDWGIVFYSEAIKSNEIKIVADIPSNLHDPIFFYMTLIKEYSNESKLIYDYIKSDKSIPILSKHGFITDLLDNV
ncbi:MAG: molybdate ABC transporter substrate-binding protein [Bacteroidetes bacterium GWF2_33_16]|nr:MAG: molybdate ABC transporter substrate-binding protein [Bacteroidetes bacterium GWE2_32_14]OFY02264.1 MAG: molybdate ABC transporter substrate-binding protein [Bacteroidetes bacterium GWF2_33_16]